MIHGPAFCDGGVWRWRLLAALFILTAAVLHLVYLASDCPLDLAPDEAHYWDWSRHLDWSYYSKGPLVAYLIRAGCALAGPWSRRLTGTDMLAVRLPAAVCGSLLLVSVYILTRQVYGREKLAAAAVALALTLPLVAAGSSLMTIDSPYACCWGWALVLGYQAVFRSAWWAWPVTGLVVGLGILAKYTMVLWLPSLFLFLLITPSHRSLLRRPGPWVLAGIAALCCLPILIWNAQHDWVTFKHVGGQAGLRDGPRWLWHGPFAYVGVQAALLLGFWFVTWAAAMIVYRPTKEPEPRFRYLWCLSAVMFGTFWLFSLKTPVQPNWPVTAYLSGLVLAAGWLERQLSPVNPSRRRWTVASLAAACVLGVAVTLMMHHSAWAQPVLLKLSGPATTQRPLPLRRFDPTCRLKGWRTLAAAVDRVRDELRAEGIEPLLAGSGWALPGELGFYCAGQPTVYSLGPVFGDRRSQYDFWRPNPIADPRHFEGQTFILVGNDHPVLHEAFDRVEAGPVVTHRERGQPIACWPITICRGFRGFRHPAVTGSGVVKW
jgi:hypothetical protein